MKSINEKSSIVFLCVIGISCVAYGMGEGNNTVFVVGLIFIIVGYLFIRSKLKESIRKKS
ncbi:MAG: hypothetical protein JSV50_07945 [Desulfobacteraceae bacterium]|nr:MAG: hypothetical protein JSV50_07945 [Desulfobacteraceae bacterium]